jgi:hypothetical protein
MHEPPALVRPYALTGGRTRTSSTLDYHTQVVTIPDVWTPVVHTLDRSILDLCRVPQAVAEVAHHIRIPLVVAKVRLDDLAAAGLILVGGGTHTDGRPNLDMLERVLAGIRRL